MLFPHLPGEVLLDFISDARLLRLVVISPSSSPDLLCQLLIAVGLARPPLPDLDRSGPRGPPLPALDRNWACRTPTASARSLVGLADFNRERSERCGPSPDFNRRESERCGPRRPQPARV